MPLLAVLALISLGLVALLGLLVRRRRIQETTPPPHPSDADDLVSALVVELAKPPESVTRRRRLQHRAAPAPPAAPTVAAPPPPADVAPFLPPDPVTVPAPAAWTARRSPYASGAVDGRRIALPDDDSDVEIHWRSYEPPVRTTPPPPSPLARATHLSAAGRIQVGHSDDDREDEPWEPPVDA